ncbi:hypothetical protein Sliba_20140 [Streptomyces nigrescens]|uniref:Uncharacterized protein n=1 Tax=Streptomyces nigrescens TaxID=1920 RepID=A0A640TGB1_STRNI|nr:hypothetical protein Sliba_20140 [Streptomyces libani subsp. libani]GGW01871.1 hypothetical protein GCM10010500_57870 [Streptomyces libani subsp. libani]
MWGRLKGKPLGSGVADVFGGCIREAGWVGVGGGADENVTSVTHRRSQRPDVSRMSWVQASVRPDGVVLQGAA